MMPLQTKASTQFKVIEGGLNQKRTLGRVVIVIPALNEEGSITNVIRSIPDSLRDSIIVVDNGSTDDTAKIASTNGAQVILERRRGYGSACLGGIREAIKRKADVIVFIDADSSDDPNDILRLLNEMELHNLDLVIGSRTSGLAEPGALPLHAKLGNTFATWMLYLRYGYRFTDLGPLRAIRVEKLKLLNMSDPTFGWTVEMQAKALKLGLKVGEIPVHYRPRIGKSKISGTFIGSVLAGTKILKVVFSHCLSGVFPFKTN